MDIMLTPVIIVFMFILLTYSYVKYITFKDDYYDCEDFTDGEYSSSTSEFEVREVDWYFNCIPQYAFCKKESYLMIFKKKQYFFEMYFWNNQKFEKSSKTFSYGELIESNNFQLCSYVELCTILKSENKLIEWGKIQNE